MTTPFKRKATLSVAAGLFALSIPFAALADSQAKTVATPTAVTPNANAITQDQAIAAIQNFYPIPADYEMSNASFQGPNGFPFAKNGIWEINYENSRPDQNSAHEGLYYQVDAGTGKVISMFFTTPDTQDSESSISAADGQKLASDLLQKLAPDQADNVQLLSSDSTSDKSPSLAVHSYDFVRIVNGTPFPYNHILIGLSPSGQLVSYENMWSDDLTFPTATPAVSADQAQSTYEESLQLTLQYTVHSGNTTATTASLVYAPYGVDGFGTFPTIDATSGQVIDTTGQPISLQTPSFKPLTDQQAALPTHELSRDEVLQLASQYPIGLDGYQLMTSTYQKSGNNQDPLWNLAYGKDGNERLMLDIDAKTGDLTNLFRPSEMGSSQSASTQPSKITFEQAKQLATEFVIKALPSRANHFAFDPTSETVQKAQDGTYFVRFIELHDGIPTNEVLSFNIDNQTGEIKNFYAQSSGTVTYPDATKAISLDKAKQDYQYNKNFALKLQYIPLYAGNDRKINQPSKIALVYAPTPTLGAPTTQLDALTEDWVSPYLGAPTDASSITDIKGNWAEKYMTNFLQLGIYTPKDHQLLPNQTVTRGEAVRALVMISKNSISPLGQPFFQDVQADDPNFSYVQQAVRLHLIGADSKTFNPNDKMTREELAAWIASALWYSDLTKVPGSVVTHFTDLQNVDPVHKNDIGVAAALGLMVGDGHSFRPQDTVTRAELAAVLTHLADHLPRNPY